MMVPDGADDSVNDDPTSGSTAATPGRTVKGTFAPGHAFGKGYPRGSLTRELRRIADPALVAARLYAIATDPTTSKRDALTALGHIFARLEGEPLKRSISLTGSVLGGLLPPGFDELTPEAKARVLDDVRERALRGDLALLTDGGDDDV